MVIKIYRALSIDVQYLTIGLSGADRLKTVCRLVAPLALTIHHPVGGGWGPQNGYFH